jgi:hypothetical protein
VTYTVAATLRLDAQGTLEPMAALREALAASSPDGQQPLIDARDGGELLVAFTVAAADEPAAVERGDRQLRAALEDAGCEHAFVSRGVEIFRGFAGG